MSNNINNVDWNKYKHGRRPADISQLLHNIVSDNVQVRKNANTSLFDELEKAYEAGTGLPLVVIPILIDLLSGLHIPEPSLITDLLIAMKSYSDIKTLEEPYKSRALQMKQRVCQGVGVYKTLYAKLDIKEDIEDLLKACEKSDI